MGVESPDVTLGDAPHDDAYAGDEVWAVAHAGPLTPLALARLRLARGWRLLVFAGLGMLVAVVLICSVPLYTTLVGNVQLQHALAAAAPTDTNVEIEVFAIPSANDGLSDITAAVASDIAPLKSFVAGTGSYLELEQKLPALAVSPKTEKLPVNPRVEPLVFDYTTALPHMKILAGRLPQDAQDGIPEVMVSAKMGLHVGDLLTTGYQAATVGDGKLTLHPLVVRVVGVWFPKNLDDTYWNGRSYDSVRPIPSNPDGPPPPIDFPLLFARGDFVTTFVPPQPPNPADALPVQRFPIVLHFVYLTNTAAITTANADQVQAAVASVKNAAQNILTLELHTSRPTAIISSVTTGTRLDQIVAMVRQQLQVLAQPLYIIVAQVVALALLFVVAMAALLVEAQAGELATLKSRGAGIVQVLAPYALQGATLAVIAALLGPLLAAALSLAVVRAYVPGAQGLVRGYLAHTISPRSVTRPALAGAALGALALVVSAWLASRLDVLAFRREQGRSMRVALWRRYYLDLILAGFCVLGYLELGQFGGLDVRAQLGQMSPAAGADPFLLAAPALLLIAGALLVLRLFPLAARLGTVLLARGRGASGMLAFAQVARGGAQLTRLTLLLTLAIGMALFALTFQASLGQNAAQMAAFIVGGDQRDTLSQPLTIQTITLLPQMRALPGVTAAMPAYRSHANVNPSNFATAGVLGVDPATFASVVSWRADYADQPLATLMQQMRAHTQGPDAGDRGHPLWAIVDRTFASDNFVSPGAIFTLNPAEASDTTTRLYFRVGAVVNDIPTMTDATVAGNILVDQHDYVTALLNPNLVNSQIAGPNEFWLRTTGTSGDDARRAHAIQTSLLPVASVLDRRALAGELRSEPINAGMSGLLLSGALIAALLAVLGSLVQAAVAARQRVTQFAILRTLGAGAGQLLGILLSQQLIVFCCGLLGGTLLGLVLATATLPFLQFSTQVASAAVLRLPPSTLALDPLTVAAFYGALVLACLLALAVSARIATRTGLGKALRIGED